MPLRNEVEAHWAQVETVLKKIASDAAYDEDGNPVKHTAEEFMGVAIRSAVAVGWLWGDGFRIMRENSDEIFDLVAADEQPTDQDLAVAAALKATNPDQSANVQAEIQAVLDKYPLS